MNHTFLTMYRIIYKKRMQGAGQLWYYSYGLFGVLRFNMSNAKASIADIRAPNKLSHCKKISEK